MKSSAYNAVRLWMIQLHLYHSPADTCNPDDPSVDGIALFAIQTRSDNN